MTMKRLLLLIAVLTVLGVSSAHEGHVEGEACSATQGEADAADATTVDAGGYAYGEPVGGQKCPVGPDGNCLDTTCEDKHEKCDVWASTGECESNGKYMLNFCKKSCNICDFDGNLTELIEVKAKLGKVGGDATLLQTPYGMTQVIDVVDEHKADIPQAIKETSDYMEQVIFADPRHEAVRHTCKERHPSCSYWKVIGECERNPAYMKKMCAPTCQTCHTLSFQERCPIDNTAPVALPEAGNLNALFTKLVTDDYWKEQYAPTILSQPNADDATKDGPWVVTLDNFLSSDECDRLVQLGYDLGYQRSGDTGKRNFDGTYSKAINSGRTSSNVFCQLSCETDEVTKNVTARIENITGVPQVNYEYIQLLKYDEGQFYNAHHDTTPYYLERQFGHRILTVFLYLNDVEGGGETEFPTLGINVTAKKGRALIWPSVIDSNPLVADGRTRHAALNVTKGLKFGANAWVHMGNFKDTYKKGCI